MSGAASPSGPPAPLTPLAPLAPLAYAVIGAGFGDEGKGATVDALVAALTRAGRRPLVVRANGGAQAAHSVVAEGRRHVFGHWGSGTLAGAPTWTGPGFVHNPPLCLAERETLRRLGVEPRLFADPRGPVTLPVDVALNQALENARARDEGRGRHGSCGIGFGEAVGRSEIEAVTVGDLVRAGEDAAERAELAARIERLSRDHAARRIARTGLAGEDATAVLASCEPALLAAWMEDAMRFARAVRLLPAADFAARFDAIVFEGAQGLLLDRDAPFFPHVTRSRTGSPAIVEVAAEAGLAHLETIYCTRAYATRHGAGPLPGEGLTMGGENLVFDDPTNVPNPYQEALRFAALNLQLVCGAVAHDLAFARRHMEVRARLCVSCLDQTGGRILLLEDGAVREGEVLELNAALGAGPDWREPILAHGPARADRDVEAAWQACPHASAAGMTRKAA